MERSQFEVVVARALVEDLGEGGDVTTKATVSQEATAVADIATRADGVIAGLDVARYVFDVVDSELDFEPRVNDGDVVRAGAIIAEVSGSARSILTGERTALNLLGRMSGVATSTARLVAAVDGTGAVISDTRKTMPGLRALDKYAVTAGGGVNHRFGLYDAVLIKDNHLVASGGLARAVAAARAEVGQEMMVEVEVENLEQLDEVMDTVADRVLLDNMDLETLRTAVKRVGSKLTTEASGGVTVDTVREIAETGVDVISVGWITHSAPQLDIGLDFHSEGSLS